LECQARKSEKRKMFDKLKCCAGAECGFRQLGVEQQNRIQSKCLATKSDILR